jgi:hypothetical protein
VIVCDSGSDLFARCVLVSALPIGCFFHEELREQAAEQAQVDEQDAMGRTALAVACLLGQHECASGTVDCVDCVLVVLVYWCTGILVYWCTGGLVYCWTVVLLHCCTVVLVLVYWCTFILLDCCTVALLFCCTVLVYW